MLTPAQIDSAIDQLWIKYLDAIQNAKPSYSIDGQSVQYPDYLRMFQDAMRSLIELYNTMNPVEIRSQIM